MSHGAVAKIVWEEEIHDESMGEAEDLMDNSDTKESMNKGGEEGCLDKREVVRSMETGEPQKSTDEGEIAKSMDKREAEKSKDKCVAQEFMDKKGAAKSMDKGETEESHKSEADDPEDKKGAVKSMDKYGAEESMDKSEVAKSMEKGEVEKSMDEGEAEDSTDKSKEEESIDKGKEEESIVKREAEEFKTDITGPGGAELASGIGGISAMEIISEKDLSNLKLTIEFADCSVPGINPGAEAVKVSDKHQGKEASRSSIDVNDIEVKDDPEEGSNDNTGKRDVAEEAKQEATEKMTLGSKGEDVTEGKISPMSSSTSSSVPASAAAGAEKSEISSTVINSSDSTSNTSRASPGWKNPDKDDEEKALKRPNDHEDLIIKHAAIAVCVALVAFLIYVMFIR